MLLDSASRTSEFDILTLQRSGRRLARGERFLRTPGTRHALCKSAPVGLEDSACGLRVNSPGCPATPSGCVFARIFDPGVRKKRSPLANLCPPLGAEEPVPCLVSTRCV